MAKRKTKTKTVGGSKGDPLTAAAIAEGVDRIDYVLMSFSRLVTFIRHLDADEIEVALEREKSGKQRADFLRRLAVRYTKLTKDAQISKLMS
jgi:hypothetical protein